MDGDCIDRADTAGDKDGGDTDGVTQMEVSGCVTFLL